MSRAEWCSPILLRVAGAGRIEGWFKKFLGFGILTALHIVVVVEFNYRMMIIIVRDSRMQDFEGNLDDSTAYLWPVTEVVSTEIISKLYSSSLAVDGAGNVHIAWYDNTNF
jgi:hypothetical protein